MTTETPGETVVGNTGHDGDTKDRSTDISPADERGAVTRRRRVDGGWRGGAAMTDEGSGTDRPSTLSPVNRIRDDDGNDWIRELEDARDESESTDSESGASTGAGAGGGSNNWLDELDVGGPSPAESASGAEKAADEAQSTPTVAVLHTRCDDCGTSGARSYHRDCHAPIVYIDDEWQCGSCATTINVSITCRECGGTITTSRVEAPVDLRPDLRVVEVERKIHEETNDRRRKHGLDALEYSDHLSIIAAWYSREMAQRGFFDHESPEGEGPNDRYGRFGHDTRSSGENIALTQPGLLVTADEAAQSVVDDWMNSPGHRENILRDQFEREGIGIHFTSQGAMYSTQNFY